MASSRRVRDTDRQWLRVLGTLNELQARVFVAQRAAEEGRGGVSRLARLTGMSRPTILKGIAELVEVWKRDGGKCVICGASNELHFDHDVPFSRGGTSIAAANVQLLCARHNLEKRDSIV